APARGSTAPFVIGPSVPSGYRARWHARLVASRPAIEGRIDGVLARDRSWNDVLGRGDGARRPGRDLPAGRASGDDPVHRGPPGRRRGPDWRRGRTALPGRADADRARVQATARRPDPDHP